MKKKRRASATLIGAFVVGGIALVATVVVLLAGGELLQTRERAVMHFKSSVYGLENGAPVVFRGVRLGSVTSIGVSYEKGSDTFTIPVVAELDRDALARLAGDGDTAALPALVARGLRAQLSMQSLLTGLLYVDLDLKPGPVPALHQYPNATEIPTTPTAIQALKNQLDSIDFKRLGDDISAIAGSARAVLAGPELKQALSDLREVAASLKRVTVQAERRFEPLASDARQALQGTRQAMDKLGRAADNVNDTAVNAKALTASDSPLVKDLRGAAEQLAQTAATLRRSAADDGPLLRDTQRALQDLSSASRALRELAETLDRHPEALLRGRPAEPAKDNPR